MTLSTEMGGVAGDPYHLKLQQSMVNMLSDTPTVPLIGIDKPEHFRALIDASLATSPDDASPVIEVLQRDQDTLAEGLEALKSLKIEYGDAVTILMGSVINADDVHNARNIGADGLVSGGFSKEVAKAALDHDLPYLPGFMTLDEVRTADEEYGIKMIKLFPARNPSVKAIMSPLARTGITLDKNSEHVCASATDVLTAYEQGIETVNLIPADSESEFDQIMAYMAEHGMIACATGGVSQDNLHEFAMQPQLIGVGASFITKGALDAADPQAALKSKLDQARVAWNVVKQRQDVLTYPATEFTL